MYHTNMKKLLLIVAAAATLAGCSKGVQCKCTATTATDSQGRPQVTYVDVDWNFPCKNITKVGFERQLDGKLVRELQDVTCEKDNR